MKLTITIQSKKSILGGVWCIAGTRIPIRIIVEHLNKGGVKLVKEEFLIDLTKKNNG